MRRFVCKSFTLTDFFFCGTSKDEKCFIKIPHFPFASCYNLEMFPVFLDYFFLWPPELSDIWINYNASISQLLLHYYFALRTCLLENIFMVAVRIFLLFSTGYTYVSSKKRSTSGYESILSLLRKIYFCQTLAFKDDL